MCSLVSNYRLGARPGREKSRSRVTLSPNQSPSGGRAGRSSMSPGEGPRRPRLRRGRCEASPKRKVPPAPFDVIERSYVSQTACRKVAPSSLIG